VRLLKTLLVFGVLGALAVGFFVLVPFGPSTETFVEVAPGTGTSGIAKELAKSGIVRSAVAFDVLTIWRSLRGRGAGTLKAGEYRFDHPATMDEVYGRLRKGDVYTVTVVVPEGFNIFDIAGAVAAARLDSREDFLRAEQQHTELIMEWVPQGRAASLEGYLFPDTYKFGRHATAEQMLTAMVHRFGKQAERLGMARGQVARTVTLASLVEKEVHIDGERPVVASVFENRLAASLLGPLIGAISGPSVARGVSFLKDRLGATLFAKGVTLTDDPHRARGLGSSPFDDEGVANRAVDIVDDGVLTTWLLNASSGRQLGLETTGHASRGLAGPPGVGPSNLTLRPGTRDQVALMREAGRQVAACIRSMVPAAGRIVAFAGPGLDTLLITTAREQLSSEQLAEFPLSGHLFTTRVTAIGLPTTPWSRTPR